MINLHSLSVFNLKTTRTFLYGLFSFYFLPPSSVKKTPVFIIFWENKKICPPHTHTRMFSKTNELDRDTGEDGCTFSEDFVTLDTKKGCFAKRTRVIILSCVNGSLGDVLPILSLAKTLRALEPSWTRICVIINEYFEETCSEELLEKDSINAI